MAQRKYDQQLKDDAIDAVVKHGRSVAQSERDFDIPVGTIYSLISAYKRKHYLVAIRKKNDTLEQENTRLKKELTRAKLEQDILKKATAYFASLVN